jgi:hypothetical protein
VRGQGPRRRGAVQARAGDGLAEQLVGRGGVRAVGRRLGLDAAQGQGLDRDAAREDHVLDRPGRVALAQAERLLEELVHPGLALPGRRLAVFERGGDLLPLGAGQGRAERGGQRHVQPPGRALHERPVVAARAHPDRLPQHREPSLGRAEAVPVLADDLRHDRRRLGVERAAAGEPVAGPGQVEQQVVNVRVLVGPQPVDRAARHPGPLDDLLQPQLLDGQGHAGLYRQLTARVQHPLPDFLRGHALRPDRHDRPFCDIYR